ncbi:hypothetical protein CEXT_56241 [Caerostris extrusa]|uniref:EGF-like domain-containing protein n=1 Tax=Caerostris extrusa TaxID=172846 RepID=A0AAV4MC25_CAEEX|nr:hypothetical protein CEXT_56241 [Caerostris extrusa]
MLMDPGSIVHFCSDCYCGINSRSCRLDWFGRKVCDCYPGYEQIDGYCLARTTTVRPRTTTRDCYCGINSRSCRLNWFGRKICDCYPGYEQIDGYCLARTTTVRPITTTRGKIKKSHTNF